MNKSLSLSLLLFIVSFTVMAQSIEITPQYGYQIGSKYSYYGGYIKLSSSDQYGFTASINTGSDIEVEFFWVHQSTDVRIKDRDFLQESFLTDVTVNHYQLGAIHTFGDRDDVLPFFGMSLGWSTFNPDDKLYDSSTKFTIGISGGLKYFFSDHIGIRLQTQLLMPIEWGGVYFSSGGGSGVSAGGTLLQLNFSGGLIFAFGR